MKIVELDAATLGDVSLDPIRNLGDLTVYHLTSKEERIDRIGDAEVIITNKVQIDQEVMDACPSLKLVCVAATGMNNVDLQYAAKKGIQVKNVAGYSTLSVTQATFALIFYLLNNPAYYDAYVKAGDYSKSPIFTHYGQSFHQLSGLKTGIIGLGTIGKKVAEIASLFGSSVQYYSTSGKNMKNPWPAVSLEVLLSSSDIVSIHAPLNADTKNLLTYNRLCLMKPDAILLNMGRGGIVNEPDLAKVLDEGKIRAAALDVYEQEPLPADHPFLQLKHPERILLMPHVAWASIEARADLILAVADNIRVYQNAD